MPCHPAHSVSWNHSSGHKDRKEASGGIVVSHMGKGWHVEPRIVGRHVQIHRFSEQKCVKNHSVFPSSVGEAGTDQLRSTTGRRTTAENSV